MLRQSRISLILAVWLVEAVACRSVKPVDYKARIGIAVRLSDRVCMAIENSKLLPSASITLLEPGGLEHERAATARAMILTRNAEACPGRSSKSGVSSYNLEITSGTVRSNLPLIALEARVPSVYAAHSFHSCASASGVHLTAWDGAKPLEGHRLWQESYNLDQGFQSNCTIAEIAP